MKVTKCRCGNTIGFIVKVHEVKAELEKIFELDETETVSSIRINEDKELQTYIDLKPTIIEKEEGIKLKKTIPAKEYFQGIISQERLKGLFPTTTDINHVEIIRKYKDGRYGLTTPFYDGGIHEPKQESPYYFFTESKLRFLLENEDGLFNLMPVLEEI